MIRAFIPGIRTAANAALACLGAVLVVGGSCAKEPPAETSSAVIRITHGRGSCVAPQVSPDGKWVAFTEKPETPGAGLAPCVVPSSGGDFKRIEADTTTLQFLKWGHDSRSLYVFGIGGRDIRKVNLEGNTLEAYAPRNWANIVGLSPDETELLLLRFNGDNYDVGMSPISGDTVRLVKETPTWETDACFGPGSDRITVVRQQSYDARKSEIVECDLASGAEAILPLPAALNLMPEWSPDGRYLAFASNRLGDADLWILDRASQRTVQVTSGPEEDYHPSWSPDGSSLVFTRRVVTLNLFVTDPLVSARRRLTQGRDKDTYPLSSPDGEWVVFVREKADRSTGKASKALCVMPTAGGDVLELGLGELEVRPGMYDWSPDASEIAFAASDASGNVDLYRVARAGGDPLRVTVGPATDLLPAWSPDGEFIAFTRLTGGETQIWAIPATGGIAVPITNHPGVNQVPVWGPDSDRVAYVSMQADGQVELCLSHRTRSRETACLTKGKLFLIPKGFSEDGEQVIVWRQEESTVYTVWALSTNSGSMVQLGAPHPEANSRNYLVQLTEAGKKLQHRIYPGGLYVYSDGEVQADIFRVRVDNLLKTTLAATE